MAEPERELAVPQITFHLIKSNFFRVVHADGAWGGVTPRGFIEVNFYSERQPIPRSLTHSVNLESGTLGAEIREARVTKEGPVREVEVGVIMDLQCARSVRKWLDDKIAVVEQMAAENKT